MSTVKTKTTTAAAKKVEQTVAAGQETIETAVKVGQEAAQKVQAAALKSYEDVQVSTKDGLDAVLKSGQILSSGLQELGKAVFGLTQATIEEGVEASKQLLAAKTIREWTELQSALSKSQVDRLVSETTRLSELSIKVVEEAIAPINAQINAGVDRIVKLAA